MQRPLRRCSRADVLQALGVKPGAELRYRRVQLVCGSRVLSEADNWYLPGHLSPAMNQVLDSTDEPFGRVVGPLGSSARPWPTRRSGRRGAKATAA